MTDEILLLCTLPQIFYFRDDRHAPPAAKRTKKKDEEEEKEVRNITTYLIYCTFH